jgi:hypothetical protein
MSAARAAALAAGLRAAAGLVEASGAAGLHVSCDDCGDGQVMIQVTGRAGDAAARAGVVAALAALMGTSPYQCDARGGPSAWLHADGQADGAPVRVYTPLAVTTRATAGGAAAPLALTADGYPAIVPDGQQLPPGWRWLTDLDGQHPADSQREVA